MLIQSLHISAFEVMIELRIGTYLHALGVELAHSRLELGGIIGITE